MEFKLKLGKSEFLQEYYMGKIIKQIWDGVVESFLQTGPLHIWNEPVIEQNLSGFSKDMKSPW